MNNSLDLSIIIVSYNTKSLLENCLRSIFQSLLNSILKFEVIVVDNHSNDGSQELIKTQLTSVRLIENADNAGFGKANNQGIKLAQGETILLLNSDIVVLDQAIPKLYYFLKNLDHEAIVAGKLFNDDQSPQASCGPAYTLPMIFTALFLKGDKRQITRYSPDETREVDWVMGACMMADKHTFINTPFDESIFMYMEEIDLQLRAKRRRVKIYFYPPAHFIHKGAGSSHGRAAPILNVFKGFLFYYKKHFGLGKVLLLRTILIVKSILAIILFILLGRSYDRDIYVKALKVSIS